MFGRKPKKADDITFGSNRNDPYESMTKYVDRLRNRMTNAYEIATAYIEEAKKEKKNGYHLTVRGSLVRQSEQFG